MDAQKEIQRIYEEKIYPELERQKGKEVVVGLSQEELKLVCDFFEMFAYN